MAGDILGVMATIRQALATALQYHQAGNLEAAEHIYRRILASAPDQADAWHLLGVAALQTGKPGIAVEHISRAIALGGQDAAMQNNLGEAQRALGRLPDAIESYRRALELKPDYAEAYNNLGNALKDQGKLDGAIECYRAPCSCVPIMSRPTTTWEMRWQLKEVSIKRRPASTGQSN